MSKFIVIPFDTEAAAYDGVNALRGLDLSGDISVYSYSVVAKAADGTASVKQADDAGPRGLAIGTLTGALIGLLAGPVGVAVGLTTGALFGSIADIVGSGAPVAFAKKVVETMKPGEVAIVAEIEEEWTTPLDTRLAELGTSAERSWRDEVEDAQIEADIAAAKQDVADLKAEIAASHDAHKKALNDKLAKAEARLAASRDAAQKKLDAIKTDADNRVEHLRSQAKTASAENKARIDARIAKIEERAAVRSQKLGKIWEDTKDLFRS